MNSLFGKILGGASYQNPTKRMATFWNFKSARALKFGLLTAWGETEILSAYPIERPFTELAKRLIAGKKLVDSPALKLSTVVRMHYHGGFMLEAEKTYVLASHFQEPMTYHLALVGEIVHDTSNGSVDDIYMKLWLYDIKMDNILSNFLVPYESTKNAKEWVACHVEEVSMVPVMYHDLVGDELHFSIMPVGASYS